MSWETRRGRGRYYTRTRRIGGKNVREYVGTGPVAESAAAEDACRRAERDSARAARKAVNAQSEELSSMYATLDASTNLLVNATLLSAGYHQHDRGHWRRRKHARPTEA